VESATGRLESSEALSPGSSKSGPFRRFDGKERPYNTRLPLMIPSDDVIAKEVCADFRIQGRHETCSGTMPREIEARVVQHRLQNAD
jgi:hypothetical protein